MDEGNRRSTAFTKQHCRILQILENKVLRIITGRGYDTPISQLLEESGQLSVHQHVAFHTLLTIFKVIKTGEPGYLAGRLGVTREEVQLDRVGARRRQYDIRLEYNKSISREGTLYRKRLWNTLPVNLRTSRSIAGFKRGVSFYRSLSFQ